MWPLVLGFLDIASLLENAWRARLPPVACLPLHLTNYDAGFYRVDVTPIASVQVGDTLVRRVCVNRVYFAFGAMLRTLQHCRPVVAADATFLTGPIPSTLYTIVGKDARNMLVPAAFMLAWSAEQMADWVPFLVTFQSKMPGIRVCISDAAKGLLEAIQQVGWRHSRCARHMYTNMQTSGITKNVAVEEVCNLAKLCCESDFQIPLRPEQDEGEEPRRCEVLVGAS